MQNEDNDDAGEDESSDDSEAESDVIDDQL